MNRSHRVAAIVLAAGLSRRAGPKNKLLAKIGDTPMVAGSVDAVLASGARPVIVVTGHQSDALATALRGRNVDFVHNPNFSDGMGSSIARGIGVLPAETQGVMICLADMPHIQPESMTALIDAFEPAGGAKICLPTNGARRGNPVLFGRHFFSDLAALRSDRGGRDIVGNHPGSVREIAVDDPGIFHDYDVIEED